MAVQYYNDDRKAYINTRKSASCAHKLDYHFVFATRYRRPVLNDAAATTLREIIIEFCRDRNLLILGLSIQPDHVHLLVGLRPTDSPAAVAHDLKGLTSFKLLGAFPEIRECLSSTKLWGRGYSVDTLGRSNVAQIGAYLQQQEAHHVENSIDCA